MSNHEAIERHRDTLEALAEKDLPISDTARELLEAIER